VTFVVIQPGRKGSQALAIGLVEPSIGPLSQRGLEGSPGWPSELRESPHQAAAAGKSGQSLIGL
jgi:hypothetical protein